MKKSIAID